MFLTKKTEKGLISKIKGIVTEMIDKSLSEVYKNNNKALVKALLDVDARIEEAIKNNSKKEKDANLLAIPNKIAEYDLHGTSDKKIRKKYAKKIKEVYGKKCAICGHSRDENLTLDHYYFPRSIGGMLVMKHGITEAWFSNCVLLCQDCNMKKGALSVDEFVTNKNNRLKIAEMNTKLTEFFRSELKK